MSFVLLVTTLATFDIRAEQENRQALSVHFEDISTRVANAVLGASHVGAQRAESEDTSPSAALVYYERLRIPTQIRGEHYTVRLTGPEVSVSAERRAVTESAPLFNLQLPPAGVCTDEHAVCTLSGTSSSAQGHVLVKYEYKRATAFDPLVNRITLG